MISRGFVFIFISTVVVTLMLLFLFSPSYQKSLQAKWHYEFGEFVEAYELSREAYELDSYNRMAFTIMQQSKKSIEIDEFIKEAKEYKSKIEKLARDGEIAKEERARIKMQCEIILESYKYLSSTVLIDKELLREAKELNGWFEKLYVDVF